MPRRVFLHVGSPKTGTTFLQNVLWSQRGRARKQGLLLPLSSVGDHYRASLDLRGERAYSNRPETIPGTWRFLVEEAMKWDGDVLVSHELFAPATQEQARRAVTDFADADEVHVVVTARDLVRQFPAHWQENVKARSSESFSDFMAGVQADVERRTWFWLVQDFAGILDRWGGELPRERLHVVTVPPRGTPSSVLWERFASLVGLDPASFDLAQSRRNESLGVEQAELLRQVNTALGERLPRPGPYASIVKGYFAHRVLAAQHGTPLGLVGPDLAYAVENSTRIAEELKVSGVDVVGDLAELVPDVEAAGASEREAPDQAAVLASSVEAVVSLMERLHEQRESRTEAVGRLKQELRGCRKELEAVRRQAASGRSLPVRLRQRWRSLRRRGPYAG